MNEQASADLTVYLELLFLTQFPHKEAGAEVCQYLSITLADNNQPPGAFTLLFPNPQKSLIVLHCGTWD